MVGEPSFEQQWKGTSSDTPLIGDRVGRVQHKMGHIATTAVRAVSGQGKNPIITSKELQAAFVALRAFTGGTRGVHVHLHEDRQHRSFSNDHDEGGAMPDRPVLLKTVKPALKPHELSRTQKQWTQSTVERGKRVCFPSLLPDWEVFFQDKVGGGARGEPDTWPTQAWFPLLLSSLYQEPILIPNHRSSSAEESER